jgi:hypothetical protein
MEEEKLIMPVPQIYQYLLKFFIVVPFELLLQILLSGIELHITPVTQQCGSGVTRLDCSVTKLFGRKTLLQYCITIVPESNTPQLICVTTVISQCLEYD